MMTCRLRVDRANTPIQWRLVVFDEVHRLKNPKTIASKVRCTRAHCSRRGVLTGVTTQNCKALRSACKIGLTGTLMQNNHEEMWAVMDQMMPGCLGEQVHFKEYYAVPIKAARKAAASEVCAVRAYCGGVAKGGQCVVS